MLIINQRKKNLKLNGQSKSKIAKNKDKEVSCRIKVRIEERLYVIF